MNWYPGSIAEAVALSISKNSIFVVYVEGNDELSQNLRKFVNDDKIKSILEGEEFVAIRIESGSQAYMQFAQIYQLVPLPSLFFIGKNGAPLEIVTGVISSADELEKKINNVLDTAGIKKINNDLLKSETQPPATSKNTQKPSTSTNIAAASNDLISNEKAATIPSDFVCENGLCYRKTPDNKKDEATNEKLEQQPPQEEKSKPEEKPSTDDQKEKIEHAKKLVEDKRKEKEAEEQRLEHEREINRRKEGQEMQNLQKWQQEQEFKEVRDNIRRERLEEQEARKRILEKIASDKAERAQKFGQISPTTPAPQPEQKSPKPSTSQKTIEASENTRIQFKKPDGESETQSFKSSENFIVVRNYVKINILQGTGIKEFRLATTFPRKEFGPTDDDRTLIELGLCPTAVLLIITSNPSGTSSAVRASGGYMNMMKMVVLALLSPFTAAFNYIRGFFGGGSNQSTSTVGAQKRASDQVPDSHDSAKKRNLDSFMSNGNSIDVQADSKGSAKNIPYKRFGAPNIHRLREQTDSDDENNTWNGNSTQQQ